MLLFPWSGDRVAHTIALWLHSCGLKVECGGLYLRVARLETGELFDHISDLLDAGVPDPIELVSVVSNARTGKHSIYLSEELAARDYASLKLDAAGAFNSLRRVL